MHTVDTLGVARDFGDVQAEAASCRSAAALFDFSFMTRVRVEGTGASALIAQLTPRRMDDMPCGRIRYGLRTNEAGDVIGDVTIWRLAASCFEVFSGSREHVADLTGVESARELSGDTAILAVQGPESLRALCAAGFTGQLRELPYFGHMGASIAGVPCRIGRLGYTGERGFELVLPREARQAIWAMIAEHARPAGFATADILRIEAGFILFSNELRLRVSAEELGLGRFAGEPLDRTAPQRGTQVRLVCFQATSDFEPILWRPPHCDPGFLPAPGEILVTSACRSTLTGGVLGLGFAVAQPQNRQLSDGTGLFREIREVSLPFYDPGKLIPCGGWGADLLPARDGAPHSYQ